MSEKQLNIDLVDNSFLSLSLSERLNYLNDNRFLSNSAFSLYKPQAAKVQPKNPECSQTINPKFKYSIQPNNFQQIEEIKQHVLNTSIISTSLGLNETNKYNLRIFFSNLI